MYELQIVLTSEGQLENQKYVSSVVQFSVPVLQLMDAPHDIIYTIRMCYSHPQNINFNDTY